MRLLGEERTTFASTGTFQTLSDDAGSHRKARKLKNRSVSLALAALIVTGCGMIGTDPTRTWFEVENRTNEPLDIVYDRAAGMILARDIPPGVKLNVDNPGEPRCTEFDVVARSNAGEEVARREPPMCGGDVWTID